MRCCHLVRTSHPSPRLISFRSYSIKNEIAGAKILGLPHPLYDESGGEVGVGPLNSLPCNERISCQIGQLYFKRFASEERRLHNFEIALGPWIEVVSTNDTCRLSLLSPSAEFSSSNALSTRGWKYWKICSEVVNRCTVIGTAYTQCSTLKQKGLHTDFTGC